MVRRYWIYQMKKHSNSCCKKSRHAMGYCKSIYSCTTQCVRQTNLQKNKKEKVRYPLGKDTVYIFLNSVMQHLPGEKEKKKKNHNLDPE